MIKSERGFSYLETMLGIVVMAFIFLTICKVIPQISKFFLRTQSKQEINASTQTTMDTLVRFLRDGKASSVLIQPGPTGVPSQIDFDSITKNIHYSIGLTADQTITITSNVIGSAVQTSHILASHVMSLIFTGDSRDMGIVNITLSLAVPYDSSGRPDHVYNVTLPTQQCMMVTGQ